MDDKIDLESKNIKKTQVEKLKEVFPEAVSEDKVDFEKLRLTLGDEVEAGKERYGMNWPGKANCFKIIQTPSKATLKPAQDESVDFDTANNLFIEGDSLEVLKLLQSSYYGKVKMIYIDPPYNTGKDFVYPDNYTESLETYLRYTGQKGKEGFKLSTNTESEGRYHSKWMNMMYVRLFLARNLLKEDGVIFISIDDHEVDNLKKICNEIFGEENHIGLISVENNPKGRKNSDFISVSNDYCLIYAKSIVENYFVENIPKNVKDMVLDENGKYVHGSGKRVLVGENSFNKETHNLDSEKHYSVYLNPKIKNLVVKKELSIADVDNRLITEGYIRYVSTRNGKFIENTYTANKLKELFESESLEFQQDKIFEKNFSDKIRIKSLFLNVEYKAIINGQVHEFKIDLKTTSANQALKELFNTEGEIFPAPKSVDLIKNFLTLFDQKDFIILDFFAGSATTAHAVLDLNKEDGGTRKFIMVQLQEPTSEDSEAYKAGYKNIAEIGKERIRRAIKKINVEKDGKLDLDDKKQDLGFRVFKLDESNFKVWEGEKPEDLAKQLELYKNNVRDDSKPEDILYELILKSGFEISCKVEVLEIAGKRVYSVEDGQLMICLEMGLSKELMRAIAEKEPTRVVCLDEGFEGNDALLTNSAEIMKAKGIEFRTV